MKKNRLALLLALLLLLSLLTACGGAASGGNMDATANSASMDAGAPEAMPAANADSAASDDSLATQASGSNSSAQTGHVLENAKVILTADLNAETQKFEETDAAIRALIDQLGGYIEYNSTEGSAGYRYASYTVRVPRAQYSAFLSQVGTLCSVTYRSESAEDISEQYFDRETRLKAQTTKRDRLLALLAQATKMEDIIALESALADVQVEIEALTGELRRYDSLVDFSTIRLSLHEVRDLTALPEESSFLSDIKLAFHNGTRGLVSFFQGLVLLLIGGWPFFVVLIVLLLIVLRIFKRRRAKKQQENAFFTAPPPSADDRPDDPPSP